jgi:hypothetical protein
MVAAATGREVRLLVRRLEGERERAGRRTLLARSIRLGCMIEEG